MSSSLGKLKASHGIFDPPSEPVCSPGKAAFGRHGEPPGFEEILLRPYPDFGGQVAEYSKNDR